MKVRKPIIVLFGIVGTYAAWTWHLDGKLPIFGDQSRSAKLERRLEPLTDLDLKAVVQTLRQNHPNQTSNLNVVKFGSKLFFDQGLSSNGAVSCATCHDPYRSFTDGKELSNGLGKTSFNAPTLVNSYAGSWFFWNGRADSLEAQALGPLESPNEHGLSRSKVVAQILKVYRSDYEENFGPLPAIEDRLLQLPGPAIRQSKVSSAVAAYALATLGSSSLQKSILKQAQATVVQPVEILKTIAAPNHQTPSAFDDLATEEKVAINTVFANVGRALAAFQRTIRTDDAAFDKFADRLKTAQRPEDALGNGFKQDELLGLRLFTGKANCILCHHGPQFTDNQFHNIGMMALQSDTIDLGRAQGLLDARDSEFNCRGPFLKPEAPSEACLEIPFIETEATEAVGGFKTPTLRNLKDTAPYGHDGRFPTLTGILLHYNHLNVPPAVGHTEESLVPLELSEVELKAMEAFLLSLQSPVSYFKGK